MPADMNITPARPPLTPRDVKAWVGYRTPVYLAVLAFSCAGLLVVSAWGGVLITMQASWEVGTERLGTINLFVLGISLALLFATAHHLIQSIIGVPREGSAPSPRGMKTLQGRH
jgi:hypothetical protein